MRKLVWPLIAAVVLLAAFFVFRQWSGSRDRARAIDAKFATAREMAADGERLSQAKVELDGVLTQAPDHLDALMLRGEVLLQLAMHEPAHIDLVAAAKFAKGEAAGRVQWLIGRVLADRYRGTQSDSDFREARNAFLAAQRTPEYAARGLEGFAHLFLEKGRNRDVDKALEVLRDLVARHPTSEEAGYAKELLEQLGRSAQGN